jgi:putative methionine-R-sulfoxide reductase with GAF domain
LESALLELQSERADSSITSLVVDIDDVPEVSDLYGVGSLPTILFFKEGTIVGSYSGSDIDAIRAMLLDFAGGKLEASGDGASSIGATEPVYPPIAASLSCKDRGRVSLEAADGADTANLSISSISMLGLDLFIDSSASAAVPSNRVVANARSILVDIDALTDEIVRSMYEYRVPTISADGTCSNTEVLAKNPFNLAVNGYNLCAASKFSPTELKSHPMTERLVRLKSIVEGLYEITQADWIGLYRLVSDVADETAPVPTLMKESYRGEPSRALFPVTEEFAKRSTNSWVALNAKGRVISNTSSIEDGVSYYKCSGKVLSELCVPILRRVTEESTQPSFEVIGIIDLESWNANHFSAPRILEVLKVAFDIGECNFLI